MAFTKKVYPLKTGPHKTKSAKTKFKKKFSEVDLRLRI